MGYRNSHRGHRSGRVGSIAGTFVICITALLGLSACGGGGGGGGNSPPPPPPPPPPADAFLLNNSTLYSGDTYQPDELSADTDGRTIIRTKLTLLFKTSATTAEVDDLLARLNATVTSSIAGARSLTIRIPDPGNIANLEDIIEDTSNEAFVEAVFKSVVPSRDALPDNITEGNTTDYEIIDNQLAVRAAAAWNARAAINSDPRVIVMDWFGFGAAQLDQFLDATVTGEVHDGNAVIEPDDHGYHVSGIIAGSYGGASSVSELVTGVYPGHTNLHIVDLSNGLDDSDAETLALIYASEQTGTLILNTSLGYDCGVSGTCRERGGAMQGAIMWADRVRALELEDRLFHATVAGNIDTPNQVARDAETGSDYSGAALMQDMITAEGDPVSPLTNTLVVENLYGSDTHPREIKCLSADSMVGGHVGAIGANVTSLLNDTAGIKSGTSMAAPQVAGLAAYLLAIRPSLSPQEIAAILRDTASAVSQNADADCSDWPTPAPAIDAYAAVLALDAPGDSPVRSALLDISNDGLNLGTNDQFDEFDIEYFIRQIDAGTAALHAGNTTVKYSRADLNGDGYDGGIDKRHRFDLDMNSPPSHTTLTQIIGPNVVDFDERNLSDNDILCYYANSALFSGDTQARDALLAGRCAACAANVLFDGHRTGIFSGPAGYTIDVQNGTWTLFMDSAEWITGHDPDDDGIIENAYGASFEFPLPVPLAGESKDISNTGINLVTSYILGNQWIFGTDFNTGACAECGGKVKIDAIGASGDGTLLGTIEFIGMEGDFNAPDYTLLTSKFRAMRAFTLAGEEIVPYLQCIQQYWTFDL